MALVGYVGEFGMFTCKMSLFESFLLYGHDHLTISYLSPLMTVIGLVGVSSFD
jgi:hypothetical protein